MLKRITVRLAIAILVFAIGIAAAAAWAIKRRSIANQGTPNKILSDLPISFCDLVRNPELYNSKAIHVRAVLIGYHETALYDPACDHDVKYIRADFDNASRQKLVEAIAPLNGAGFQRGNFWADVVLAGRFEKTLEVDCRKNTRESGVPDRRYINYCYRVVVSDVEQASAVSSNAEWPK